MALLGIDFTKNQLPDVSIQREYSWGSNIINRTCYEQWVALACRLGMSSNSAEITKTLRSWMETSGPVPSINRGGYRESAPAGPSTSSSGAGHSGRDSGRGRNRTRDDSPGRGSRSRSRGRRDSLNRGQSGQYLGQKRSRFD